MRLPLHGLLITVSYPVFLRLMLQELLGIETYGQMLRERAHVKARFTTPQFSRCDMRECCNRPCQHASNNVEACLCAVCIAAYRGVVFTTGNIVHARVQLQFPYSKAMPNCRCLILAGLLCMTKALYWRAHVGYSVRCGYNTTARLSKLPYATPQMLHLKCQTTMQQDK